MKTIIWARLVKKEVHGSTKSFDFHMLYVHISYMYRSKYCTMTSPTLKTHIQHMRVIVEQ